MLDTNRVSKTASLILCRTSPCWDVIGVLSVIGQWLLITPWTAVPSLSSCEDVANKPSVASTVSEPLVPVHHPVTGIRMGSLSTPSARYNVPPRAHPTSYCCHQVPPCSRALGGLVIPCNSVPPELLCYAYVRGWSQPFLLKLTAH